MTIHLTYSGTEEESTPMVQENGVWVWADACYALLDLTDDAGPILNAIRSAVNGGLTEGEINQNDLTVVWSVSK